MKILAAISSILFHPLLILFYSLFLLMSLKPHLFGAVHWSEQSLLLILIFIYTCLVPGIGFLLLRFTGLVKNFSMPDRYDRFAPLIICAIFNLWMWVNLKSQSQIPKLMIAFILTSIISIFIAFVFNTRIKVSLHAIGISAFCCLWLLVRLQHSDDGILQFRFSKSGLSGFHLNHLIGISFILVGWVGTTRLFLKAHEPVELYLGYFIGAISVILAFSYTF